MLAYALDWAHLLVRWLHVTAAIAWVGTSFYYIALDYHLVPGGGRPLPAAGEDIQNSSHYPCGSSGAHQNSFDRW